MARELELKRLQLLNRQVEKEKLQNSRDFNEITLAITLLAGLTAFLLKLVDYFNNHIITLSAYFQVIVYFLVGFLLLEFLTIFLFLISKGYLVSTKYKNNMVRNISEGLFRRIFIFGFISIVFSILAILSYYFFKDVSEKNYYYYLIVWYIAVLGFFWLSIYHFYRIDLLDLLKNIRKKLPEKILPEDYNFQDSLFYYGVIIIISLVVILLFVASSSLLMGSFSVEQFPETANPDIITFAIKETGITYSANYINLYKMKSSNSTIFQNIDNITMHDNQEAFSKNKIMFGEKHEGIWFLNVNTSNLQYGTYLLHSEVTNDMTIKSVFGAIKKHDDKLFYIAPRSANYSFYSTQELKGNLTQ